MKERLLLQVEENPYGTDITVVLEDEIYTLLKEIEHHKIMAKASKGKGDIHKRMLKAKRKTVERLMKAHPDGEEAFLA